MDNGPLIIITVDLLDRAFCTTFGPPPPGDALPLKSLFLKPLQIRKFTPYHESQIRIKRLLGLCFRCNKTWRKCDFLLKISYFTLNSDISSSISRVIFAEKPPKND